MQFAPKTIRCNQPGLSQEQALAGLYQSYGDVRVASIRRQGDTWVATILKQAQGESPLADMPEDKGAPDGTTKEKSESEDTSASDSPADDLPGVEDDDGDEHSEGEEKKGGEQEILHMLHTLIQGLTDAGIIQPSPHDTMVPGDEAGPTPPGGPPAPGPGPGGPAGAGPRKPTKLSPGEVLPSQTPVGAPAFSHTKQAGLPCPRCGGQTLPDGSCPACETKDPQAAAIAPPSAPGAPQGPLASVKQATITVESDPMPRGTKASSVTRSLQTQFAPQGYKVKELVPVTHPQGVVYRALLSVH